MRIALWYAALGSAWIFCSGRLLHLFVHDSAMAATLEDLKGWFFVISTALVLGLALGRYFREIRRSAQRLEENEAMLRLVEDNLPGGYVYRYVHEADGTPRFTYISAGVERVHGVAVADVLRDADCLHAQIDPDQRKALAAVEAESARGMTDFEMDLQVRRADGQVRRVHARSRPRRDSEGRIEWDGFASDVTDQRRAEGLQSLSGEILSILNDALALPAALQRILAAIKGKAGFDAVGIRLRQGDDFPYFCADGFSEEFLRAENNLAARGADGGVCRDEHGNLSLECTCGLVLSGKAASAQAESTAGGSVWVNDAESALQTPASEDPRLKPRNRCLHEGYQSVALIPIRASREIVGLLQLNDRRKGCFTPEIIRFFEGIAASFGVALLRRREEEALRESEAKWRSYIEHAPVGVLVADAEGRHVEANRAAEEMLGYEPGGLIGSHIMDLPAEEAAKAAAEHLAEITTKGRAGLQCPLRRKDGGRIWASIHGSRLPDGRFTAVLQDITERKAHEREIERLNRLCATLSQVNQAVVRCQSRAELFDELCRVMVEFGKFRSVEIAFRAGEGGALTTAAHRAAPETTPALPLPGWAGGCGVTAEMMRTGCPAVCNEAQTDPRAACCRDALARLGIRSCAALPLSLQGELCGALRICSDESGFFNAEEMRLLSEVASDIAFALDRLHEQEHRRQAEKALRESERLLRTVIDLVPHFIFAKDRQSRHLLVNRACAAANGLTPERMTGLCDLDFVPDRAEAEEFMRADREVIDSGQPKFLAEERLTDAAGQTRILQTIKIPFVALGGVPALLGCAVDITERKQVEEALRESEQQFRAMFEVAAIGMAQADPRTGHWLRVNRKMCEITGYSPEEMLRMVVSKITHPEDQQRDWEVFQRVVRGEAPDYRLEKRYLRKDGAVAWVNVNMTVIRDAEGRPVRTMATIEDITQRKRVEEALRESEERFRSLYENAVVGFYRTTPDGRIFMANPALLRMLGYSTLEELAQRNLEQEGFEPDYSRAEFKGRLEREGQIRGLEAAWKRRDGSSVAVSENCTAVRDASGRTLFYDGSVEDITDRKKAEAALRASLEEQTALLKEVHHRVKNNLQVVASLLNLQTRRILNPVALTALRNTQDRIRSMALLHETLYREGNAARVNCAVYLGHLCSHLSHAFSPQTDRIRLDRRIATIDLDLDEAIPCGLIVNELISNAYKHAFPDERAGLITVETRAESDDRLVLSVADDGVGLPAGSDAGRADSMGMELVRGLAAQLDAALEIKSPPGTRVQVVFRRRTAQSSDVK
ncbi:MAG: PAS domain S-box protein [Limisphaerales bacterium]